MSIKIVNTENGTDFSVVQPAILVDTNGDYALLGGSGTLTYSGVTGPGSSTANAVALWNGTAGATIKNSDLTYASKTLVFPTAAQITLTSGTLTSAGDLNITGAGDIHMANGGDINIDNGGDIILGNANGIVPDASGVKTIGTAALPFANVYTQQINAHVLAGMSPIIVANDLQMSGTNAMTFDDISYANGGITSLVAGREIAISASSGVNISCGSDGGVYIGGGQNGWLNFTKQIEIGCGQGIILNSASGVTCGAFVSSPVYKTTVVSSGASTGTSVVDWTQGASQHYSFASAPSGVATILFSGASAGSSYVLKTIQNNTGDVTVNWSGNFLWRGGSVGALTVASGASDIFTFYYDGTNFLGNAGNDYK